VFAKLRITKQFALVPKPYIKQALGENQYAYMGMWEGFSLILEEGCNESAGKIINIFSKRFPRNNKLAALSDALCCLGAAIAFDISTV
jgi:hypothetical protein